MTHTSMLERRPRIRPKDDFWLARCEGFRVATPEGRLGTVFGVHIDPARIGGVMTRLKAQYRAHAGDVVAVHGHHLGETGRLGEIIEVLGEPDHPRLRIRWEDDRESILSPSSDAVIEPRRRIPQELGDDEC